jgi:hypothetical protein
MKHKDGFIELSTWDLIKQFFNKNKMFKNKESIFTNQPPPDPGEENINYLAVILDDEVQEVLRAENRLAALFLSNPEFVEFNPSSGKYPMPGFKYINEEFVDPNEMNK